MRTLETQQSPATLKEGSQLTKIPPLKAGDNDSCEQNENEDHAESQLR